MLCQKSASEIYGSQDLEYRPPDSSQHTAHCSGRPWLKGSFKKKKKKPFIFWLCLVFIAALGFSLLVASKSYSLVVVLGLRVVVASLVAEPQALGACGLQ